MTTRYFPNYPSVNDRFTPEGKPEDDFRLQVRDILDLHVSTRDDQIFDELRRLKALEAKK